MIVKKIACDRCGEEVPLSDERVGWSVVKVNGERKRTELCERCTEMLYEFFSDKPVDPSANYPR
jgi:hypothetical protein